MGNGQLNWIGRKLGQYEIEAVIGRSQTAVVYRAFQPQFGRWVAIKFLKIEPTANQEVLARFHHKANSISDLHHPHILTIYDYGEAEGMPYIVMEYVPNRTVGALPDYKPLTWVETAVYTLPIAHSIAYAHSKNIIHCSIKPENIFLPRTDWPLLSDFGLLSLYTEGIEGGEIADSPFYLSPEQIRGRDVDHRTDIYSFGILLYRLLTRKWPFGGDTKLDITFNRLHRPPTPAFVYNKTIPHALDLAILRALSIKPVDRYPTMSAFISALNAVPAKLTDLEKLQIETTVFNPVQSVPSVTNSYFIIEGDNSKVPAPLQDELLIGRVDSRMDKQPDVNLSPHGGSSTGVSREHAYLRRSGAGWQLLDLNSTNGTFVNNVRLTPRIPSRIRNGDLIRFGKLRMTFIEEVEES